MEKQNIIASYGKIRIDNSDGSFTELDFVMPKDVSDKVLCNIINWEDEWMATAKTHNEYKETEKDFLEKRKINKNEK